MGCLGLLEATSDFRMSSGWDSDPGSANLKGFASAHIHEMKTRATPGPHYSYFWDAPISCTLANSDRRHTNNRHALILCIPELSKYIMEKKPCGAHLCIPFGFQYLTPDELLPTSAQGSKYAALVNQLPPSLKGKSPAHRFTSF